MNFALKLKELREEKGITQVKLAEIFSVSKGAVGLWETGQRVPKAEQLLKIANFFGVSVSELLGEHDNDFIEENHVEEIFNKDSLTVGQKVAEIRKSKKMNLRQFGELVQLRFGYINQLEKDRANAQSTKQISPTLRTLVQICDKTGYDFALFLAETGYLNPERVCMNDDEMENLQQFRQRISTENMENILEMEQILKQADKNEEAILKK